VPDLTIPAALKSLGMAGAASRALAAWSKKRTGDSRALLNEIQNNLRYLDLVGKDGVPLSDVVEKIQTAEFDRLSTEGFNFNALKKRRIPSMPSLKGSELESWQGKQTQELVFSIYDKIKDIAVKYPHIGESKNYRWGIRVQNIRKRIWLLAKHLNS